MAVINEVTEAPRRIWARLYPSYPHGVDGAFITEGCAQARRDCPSVIGWSEGC